MGSYHIRTGGSTESKRKAPRTRPRCLGRARTTVFKFRAAAFQRTAISICFPNCQKNVRQSALRDSSDNDGKMQIAGPLERCGRNLNTVVRLLQGTVDGTRSFRFDSVEPPVLICTNHEKPPAGSAPAGSSSGLPPVAWAAPRDASGRKWTSGAKVYPNRPLKSGRLSRAP